MATLNEAYEAEVKRVRDTFGPDAEIPHPPYGQIRGGTPPLPGSLNVPTMSPSQRIAELAQHVAEAGHALQVARAKFSEAQAGRSIAEKGFIEVSERLMQAIQAHREGADENVPYGLR
jgi:hypothetical protein